MRIMIFPLEGFADTGLSIKVFMPLVYNKLLMLDCKIFCLCKFARLHSDRLTQDDLALHEENRFPVSALYVHVDWGVVVAVEEESQVEAGWKRKRRHAVDCDLKAFFARQPTAGRQPADRLPVGRAIARQTRMPGGVGGVTGAIPSPLPD